MIIFSTVFKQHVSLMDRRQILSMVNGENGANMENVIVHAVLVFNGEKENATVQRNLTLLNLCFYAIHLIKICGE